MTALRRFAFQPKRCKITWGAAAARKSGLRLAHDVSRAVSMLAGYGGLSADVIRERLKAQLSNVDQKTFEAYVDAVQFAADLTRPGSDPRTEALVRFIERVIATIIGKKSRDEFLSHIDESITYVWESTCDADAQSPLLRRLPAPIAWIVSACASIGKFTSCELTGVFDLEQFGVTDRVVRYWALRLRRDLDGYRCHLATLPAEDVGINIGGCLIFTVGIEVARRVLDRLKPAVSEVQP